MSKLFFEFINVIDVFLKLLEFTALMVSIFTFFFLMMNGFSKALKSILSPCSMSLLPRLRALMICRKSPIKKRMFIEYALMKTQGYPVVNSQWHTIINEFKSFYAEHENDAIYIISNCTNMLGEEFSQAVRRYFDFFSERKMKKTFGISEGPIGWVLKIHVEEAYATPTCLLTGLLATYEESWSEFIKKYVSTAYMSESTEITHNDILPNELYFTFAWLLWGPSYELKYKDCWAGLCQLSYGDESNSIPAVIDHNANIANGLLRRFEENAGRRYGALLTVDISIYEKKRYYKDLKSIINPENEYFYNKIEGNDSSFAVQIDNFTPCNDYKAKKYYCTAYVWLLFELENDEFEFKPERSVAFFEHANLADKSTYQFLIETLIEKSIKHFEDVFSQEKYSERKYRFVCAMNTEIEKAFVKRYNEIISSEDNISKNFKERIVLESKHVPSMVFSTFDEFFSRYSSVEFEEVFLNNKESLSNFAKFYTETYMECFPDSDERETFDNFLYYLGQAEKSDKYKYHIILAKNENGDILGGGVFNYFLDTNAGMIQFLAVKQELQSGGVGTMIYKKILDILSRNAYNNRQQLISNIFCEIDSPQYSRSSEKKYLHFWNKHRYKHIEFSYVQPALSEQQNSVQGLWLTVSRQNNYTEALSGRYVLNVLHDYMKYCMKIDNPVETDEYKIMAKELFGMHNVKLNDIIRREDI